MMTDDEIKAAARYFTSIPATPWITVVESATVPRTKPQNGMFPRLEGEDVEPIGERIIETPGKQWARGWAAHPCPTVRHPASVDDHHRPRAGLSGANATPLTRHLSGSAAFFCIAAIRPRMGHNQKPSLFSEARELE